MSDTPKPPVTLIGLVRIRSHCTFTWRRPEDSDDWTVEIRSNHCPRCLFEVQRLGYRLVYDESDHED